MRIQLLLLCALLKGTFSYAATFVPDTDDVPLMSELSPCDDYNDPLKIEQLSEERIIHRI